MVIDPGDICVVDPDDLDAMDEQNNPSEDNPGEED
jgi:hypothetical protein